MARQKNATFVGTPIVDVDVGAPSFERLIENAVGDTALTFDKGTGSHAEAGVIVHDGGDGTGALLGVPIINQWIGRTLVLENPDTSGKNGGVGDTQIFAAPFHLAAGETSILVEVSMALGAGLTPYAKVCDTANAEVVRADLVRNDDEVGEVDTLFSARLSGITAGWNLFFIGIDTSEIRSLGLSEMGALNYVRVRPRLRSDLVHAPGSLRERGAQPEIQDAGGDIYGVTTPAATEGVAHTDFEASLFANLKSIDGYVLSRLNRNLNGLAEFISGWPAGGNTTFVHEDQDGGGAADATNPARSRFEAHTRSLYANEGQVDFPVACAGFGAFLDGLDGYFAVDLAEPPTLGMLEWYPPWPRNDTEQTIRNLFVPMPDFQSASSRLQCAVLFGSTNDGAADPTQWTIKAKTTTGNATHTLVAGDDTDGRGNLWLAIITAVPFTGDAGELVEIRMSRASAKPAGLAGIGEICMLGAALAFVKP